MSGLTTRGRYNTQLLKVPSLLLCVNIRQKLNRQKQVFLDHTIYALQHPVDFSNLSLESTNTGGSLPCLSSKRVLTTSQQVAVYIWNVVVLLMQTVLNWLHGVQASEINSVMTVRSLRACFLYRSSSKVSQCQLVTTLRCLYYNVFEFTCLVIEVWFCPNRSKQ